MPTKCSGMAAAEPFNTLQPASTTTKTIELISTVQLAAPAAIKTTVCHVRKGISLWFLQCGLPAGGTVCYLLATVGILCMIRLTKHVFLRACIIGQLQPVWLQTNVESVCFVDLDKGLSAPEIVVLYVRYRISRVQITISIIMGNVMCSWKTANKP